MIGTYKNRDYIQTMRMQKHEFVALIDQLRDMNKYGKVAFVDAMPEVKTSVLREMRW